MLHFPSTLKANPSNGIPRRTDSLNATQHKSGSNPIFLQIEEELHDARRVRAHGQEEDLRQALDMVIKRVVDMSSLLSEAYRSRADLEVQLNVAKSNLALVIANNEMLEDALRRDSSGSSREVGWRRRSGKDSDTAPERQSLDEWQQVTDNHSGNESCSGSTLASPQIPNTGPSSAQENNRFFKFRFTSNSSASRPTSRPSTPSTAPIPSPQMPNQAPSPILPPHIAKEIEDLNSELDKERSARKIVEQAKSTLEAELESLSQALFEEANKMVAVERIKLSEAGEELKELKMEKEALKRALRLIEGENNALRETNALSIKPLSPESLARSAPTHISRPRSSSEIAIKSRPGSPVLESTYPHPALPTPEEERDMQPSTASLPLADAEEQATPISPQPRPLPPSSPLPSDFDHTSPWADIPSSTPASPSQTQAESGTPHTRTI